MKKKISTIVQRRHRNLPSFPEFRNFFFKGLKLANTGYGTSIYFKNINLQYFAILLDNKLISYSLITMYKLETMTILFKKLCEKKSFYQTLRFALENFQKSGNV